MAKDNQQFSYDHLSDREILILTAQKLETLTEDSEDHETRLTAIETAKTYFTGAAAGLGAVGFGWMAKLHGLVNDILISGHHVTKGPQ